MVLSRLRRRMSRAGAPYGSVLLGRSDQSTAQLRARVQVLLTVVLLTINVVGTLVVTGLALLVRPREPLAPGFALALWIAVPVYAGGAMMIGVAVLTRRFLRALSWLREERAPSPDEVRDTVRGPRLVAVYQGALWLLAVVVFGTLSGLLQTSLLLTVVLAVGLTGLLVCAIAYLWTEFLLRPVAARALLGGLPRTRGSGVRRRLAVFWTLGTGVPVAIMMLVAVLALVGVDRVARTRLSVIVLVLGGVVLLVGAMITHLTSRAVVAPVRAVETGMRRVEAGDYDVSVAVYDATELGRLQAGFNAMADGLRERERIRDLFGRQVGRSIADAALRDQAPGGHGVALGGEVRTVSVVFVDLAGSTALAETTAPEQVVALLNRFCTVIIEEVDAAGGTVNKFLGDAVLAVFGAPRDQADHAAAALRTARAVARRLRIEVPEARWGVGVGTGEAVAGNVGAEQRYEYTVIGDAVNQAARLTELAKRRDEGVLASAACLHDVPSDERSRWAPAGSTVLRGRSGSTDLVVPRSEDAGAQASDTSSA